MGTLVIEISDLRNCDKADQDGTEINIDMVDGRSFDAWFDQTYEVWLTDEEYNPETMVAPREEPAELDERCFAG